MERYMERIKLGASLFIIMYVFLYVVNFTTSLQSAIVTGEMPILESFLFIGMMSLIVYIPFSIIPVVCIFIFFKPVQAVIMLSRDKSAIPDDLFTLARKRTLAYPRFLVAVMLIVFIIGNIVLYVVVIGDLMKLFTFEGLIRFINNSVLALIIALLNISVANRILQNAREIFKIHTVSSDRNERDMSLKNRSMALVLLLVLNALVGFYVSTQEVYRKETAWSQLMTEVVAGTKTESQAREEFTRLFSDEVAVFDLDAFISRTARDKQLGFQVMFIIIMVAFTGITMTVQVVFSRDFAGQIDRINHRLKRLVESRGRLDDRINISMLDEVGVMASTINDLLTKLHNIMLMIRNTSLKLSESSNSIIESVARTEQSIHQVHSGTQLIDDRIQEHTGVVSRNESILSELLASQTEMAGEIDRQWQRLNDTARGIEMLLEQVMHVDHKVDEIVETENALIQNTQTTEKAVSRVVESIVKIESTSLEVSKVVEFISDVASRTNLLALNASIESAHAGEAGKGFAVVAEEIRKLASNSSQSAGTIISLIDEMVMEIKTGVDRSKTAKLTLDDMIADIQTTSKLIQSIKEDMKIQSTSAKQLEDNTRETVSEMEQIKSRSESEQKKNVEIKKSVHLFVQTNEAILDALGTQSRASLEMKEQVNNFKESVEKNSEVVYELGQVIDLFEE
jgi:methyl-accepting chemotaxis protein